MGIFTNLQNSLSQGVGSMLGSPTNSSSLSWMSPAKPSPVVPAAPTKNVPTVNQTQTAKLVASTNVPNTSVPKVQPTQQSSSSVQQSPQQSPIVPTVNPFQTSALTSASSMPTNYSSAQQNAYEANAPIDLNKLAPYSQQVEEANKGVADAQNAQRDFERGTYNQAANIGAVNPTQLDNEISVGNRYYNQNIADQSQNQIAANQTLATQLALQQAARTGRQEQAQIPFTTATPVTVAPGNSLINPYSGQSVAQGGTSPDIPTIASQVISGQLTQDDANKLIAYNPTLAAQLNAEVHKQNPGFSAVAQGASIGADTSSLQGQQQLADNNKVVLGTVTQNGNNILSLMKRTGVGDTGVPAITAITRGISNNVLTNNDLAAFNEALNTLRSNYAQINARGGSVTQENKDAANSAIPPNISVSGLQAILEQMWNGANTNLTESQKQIDTIKSRLGGSSQSSTSGFGWNG